LFKIIRLFYGIFYLITKILRIKIITINIIYKNTSLRWVLHSQWARNDPYGTKKNPTGPHRATYRGQPFLTFENRKKKGCGGAFF
jgi:hypothetical protein